MIKSVKTLKIANPNFNLNDVNNRVSFKSNQEKTLERSPKADKVEKKKGLSNGVKVAIGLGLATITAGLIYYFTKGKSKLGATSSPKPSTPKLPGPKPTDQKPPSTLSSVAPKPASPKSDNCEIVDVMAERGKCKLSANTTSTQSGKLEAGNSVSTVILPTTKEHGKKAAIAALPTVISAATIGMGGKETEEQIINSDVADIKPVSSLDDNLVLSSEAIADKERKKAEDRFNDEMIMAAALATADSVALSATQAKKTEEQADDSCLLSEDKSPNSIDSNDFIIKFELP